VGGGKVAVPPHLRRPGLGGRPLVGTSYARTAASLPAGRGFVTPHSGRENRTTTRSSRANRLRTCAMA